VPHGLTQSEAAEIAERLMNAQQFSTAPFAPSERPEAWHEAYGRTIARLAFEPVREAPFAVEATLRALPGLGIASLATQGLRFSKPCSLINSDDLIMVIVEAGGYAGSQLGREVNLATGDAAVRLNAEVASGRIFGRQSIIRVPTSAIAHMIGDLGACVHQRIAADTEALWLLRQYIRAMQHAHSLASSELQRLSVTHVCDMLALMLGATRDAANTAASRGGRAARLHAIKQDIAAHLAHGDVSLEAIAKRHRVSPRTLQNLFWHDGTTFSEYVLERRLELAHRLLTDPRQAREKIASIAFATGFGDLSYFYRGFRRRYGVQPSDLRASAKALRGCRFEH
jgi:AraC-like DNA-binding protein